MATLKIDTKTLIPIVVTVLLGVIGWLFNTIEDLQTAHAAMMEQLRILEKDLDMQESLFSELLFKQLFRYVIALMVTSIVIVNSFINTISVYLVRKENRRYNGNT
jgi:hypothetical protein